MKLASLLLEKKYPGTAIHPVKAGFSSDLRRRLKLVKCREINDYHHAHDAYLACELGQFITMRHPKLYDNPIGYTHAVKSFIKNRAEYAQKHGKPMYTYGMPGSSSFVISSFLTSGFDEETGEIFKDAWSAETAAARIHKAFNRKDCYISRMPEETSGAFWDATIYSPKQSKKKLSLPLKKGLDPEKYGSYSSEKFAYFSLYEAKNKRGKKQVEFIGVPIPVAQKTSLGQINLNDYLTEDAVKKGLVFLRILRGKILKYSRIRYGNDEYYIAAIDAVYSSRQPAFTQDIMAIGELIEKNKTNEIEHIDEKLLLFYDALLEKATSLCSRFNNVRSVLLENRDKFIELDREDKCLLLVAIMDFYHGRKTRVNLSLVGGSANAGGITNGFIKNDTKNLIFIDQSVTGMFERKTYL